MELVSRRLRKQCLAVARAALEARPALSLTTDRGQSSKPLMVASAFPPSPASGVGGRGRSPFICLNSASLIAVLLLRCRHIALKLK